MRNILVGLLAVAVGVITTLLVLAFLPWFGALGVRIIY